MWGRSASLTTRSEAGGGGFLVGFGGVCWLGFGGGCFVLGGGGGWFQVSQEKDNNNNGGERIECVRHEKNQGDLHGASLTGTQE